MHAFIPPLEHQHFISKDRDLLVDIEGMGRLGVYRKHILQEYGSPPLSGARNSIFNQSFDPQLNASLTLHPTPTHPPREEEKRNSRGL